VSVRKKDVVVSRNYRLAPDDCARALEFLLKPSVRKEGGPETAPKNAKVRSEDDSRAMGNIP
jgi:hypothetical protein